MTRDFCNKSWRGKVACRYICKLSKVKGNLFKKINEKVGQQQQSEEQQKKRKQYGSAKPLNFIVVSIGSIGP